MMKQMQAAPNEQTNAAFSLHPGRCLHTTCRIMPQHAAPLKNHGTSPVVHLIEFAYDMRNDYSNNQAYSEYKHILANILRSPYVAGTPPLEARSPGRRSNVENASVTCWSLISNARALRVN